MVYRRALTHEQKLTILRLRTQKKLWREIADLMACSIGTVARVIRQQKEQHTVVLKPHPGSKRVTTVREDRQLLRMYKRDRSSNSRALAESWHVAVPSIGTVRTRTLSARTVQRRLKSFGLKNYVKMRKVPLNQRQRKRRYDLCLRHKDWTVEDWRKVVFSDECNLQVEQSGGCRTVWRKPEERLSDFALSKVN
jgi:transposase